MNKNYIFIVAITMCLMVILCNNMVASKKSNNRKRKNVKQKKKKKKKKPTAMNAAPPIECEMKADGTWSGEGCQAFMEQQENSISGKNRRNRRKNKAMERKMPKTVGLDWILHPFPREKFFKEHYQKKPLIIQRKEMLNNTVDTTDYYADLFPMLGLAKCIDSFPNQRLNNDFVIVKEGFITPPQFKKVHDAYGAYLSGHTLAAFIMNRLWANLGKLVDSLESDFGFPFRVNVYLTPRGSQGFFPHTDQHDFFILQMAGEKLWHIYNNPVKLPTRKQELGKITGKPLTETDTGKPQHTVLLKQGDILYAPRGFIHSAVTTNRTGSMHLTVRILNSFFFKWGNFFEKALPKGGSGKKIGLPPWKELQELDLEFRYSTPLNWIDIPSRKKQYHVLREVLCKNDTSDDDGNAAEKANKKKRKCDIQDRWVDAFYRAKRKWRKSKKKRNRDATKRIKEKLRKWINANLKIGNGAKELVKLKKKIDDEHHRLLKAVSGMYPKGLKCSFDLNQLCLVREGVKVLPFIKGISERVVVEYDGENHTFRPELFTLLKEIESYSKSRKPFLVKNLQEGTDDFEKISIAQHLRDLNMLDPVELQKRKVLE